MLKKHQFYINGEWVTPDSTRTFPVINPATEDTVAEIILGNTADADRAVAAAKAAFDGWSRTPMSERVALLRKFGEIYARRYDEMAEAIILELGAPRVLATKAQAATGVGHLNAFLKALDSWKERSTLPNGDTILREPIGVCAMITPWNWPVNQIALKVIPALATGNTCVLKPSEMTPLSGLLYAEMLDEAGFPAGVFNLVNGDGPEVGARLSEHPDVDMVSFTGSTRAGKAITKAAAETIKRVTLELGGKSPNIVFADADLPRAIKTGVAHCMNNTGQSCNAPTRMLVERSVYDEALPLIKDAAEKVQVGDPQEEGRHIGPLVSAVQFDRVQSLIQQAIDEGTKVLTGGAGKPEGVNRGYFCRPTVFFDATNDMTIAREEVFGPVLTVIPFEDEEDAIRIANDTPYGLAAYVQTGDDARAERVSARLRAGMVHVNGASLGSGSPFGGYKMSGNGREGGMFGLEDFVEVKALMKR